MDMHKSAVSTVVFDLDGTLLDTLDDLADSVNYALGKYNMPLKTREQVCSYVGNGIKVLISKSVPENTGDEDKNCITEIFTARYRENCRNKTKPYDGVIDVMKKLKSDGYKMAIVSNKYDLAVKELAKYYFGDIDLVAMGENESAGIAKKPAPEMVFAALKELGTKAENAVYIGDSDVDIKTAENSGLPCISVTWGFRSQAQLLEAGAKILIDKPEELPGAVKLI